MNTQASLPRVAASRGWAHSALRLVHREPGLACGALVMFVLLAIALLPTLFTSQSPFAIDMNHALQAPSAAHLFGTDDTGRDVYARVIHGTRITLSICAGSLLLAGIVGGLAGALSGFAGGWLDQVLGRLVDVILSFPPIILGMIVAGVLGPATRNLVLALSVVYLPVFFRIARSGVLGENSKTYVEAARSVGLTEAAILWRHVLRNILPLLFVQYVILFPLVLQIQAALGFLGLGVQPPSPDWGAILQQGKDSIMLAPWLSLYPGLAILLAAFSLLLVGRGLQRLMDRR
ncbi:ABC transporter permease [Ramlibacter ginsenosidimutans]|uniref:ABC transporter permease n=1 Tax=Ramlibacter ginsenosidimutans TaxID=502333 RepID=A0A934TWG6_9BURK|nr:ABC transporter permease [Ramlibacter ginsenosidimutans]MBK6008739.1 ABC transporter permease [Ramlibacter ginsenosidimutans]